MNDHSHGNPNGTHGKSSPRKTPSPGKSSPAKSLRGA